MERHVEHLKLWAFTFQFSHATFSWRLKVTLSQILTKFNINNAPSINQQKPFAPNLDRY